MEKLISFLSQIFKTENMLKELKKIFLKVHKIFFFFNQGQLLISDIKKSLICISLYQKCQDYYTASFPL